MGKRCAAEATGGTALATHASFLNPTLGFSAARNKLDSLDLNQSEAISDQVGRAQRKADGLALEFRR